MIDFSCKKDIYLEDEEGFIQSMSEPYFRHRQIAPGTWQVLSDGDYSYLVEGENEALLIDSGYGAGNIREYCQTVTEKPLSKIANTHDHFDHTANNSYFELAYMSAATRPLATRPFPSFDGIDFPRDYPVQIVADDDVIDLGGRTLQVFEIPDHAVGSLVFLDRRERLLFSGDEFMENGKALHGGVRHWLKMLEKLLPYRGEFDRLCAGGWILDAGVYDAQLACVRYILDGHEGEPAKAEPFPNFERTDELGRRIWKRRIPHPGDGPSGGDADLPYKRTVQYAGTAITYDIRKLND